MLEQYFAPSPPRSTQEALELLYKRGPVAWHQIALRIADRLVVDPATGCIDWTGCFVKSGIPVVQLYGRQVSVARVQWVLRGQKPTAAYQRLKRRCGRLSCLNVDHFELEFTVGQANKLKTACSKGHDYTPRNTIHWKGKRLCIKCCGGDAADVAMFVRPHEFAFGYFQWDEAMQRYTTAEEREAAAIDAAASEDRKGASE